MIDIPDFPETPHPQRERGRIQAQVQRTDDNSGQDDRPGRVHPGACPVISPHPWGVLHLLVAHDGLTEGHVYRCYGALCGVLLPTSELPPATCPDDCELDVLYCSECVRTAAEWTVEAQRAERASGTLR